LFSFLGIPIRVYSRDSRAFLHFLENFAPPFPEKNSEMKLTALALAGGVL